MGKDEPVEVKVELPRDTYNALNWYVRLTGYWVSDESKDKAISAYIAREVRGALEAEATGGAPLAAEFTADELKRQLDLD